MAGGNPMKLDGPGTRPDPDPTSRTIDQVRREIGSLRELVEARLEGMDTAVKIVAASAEKLPLIIDQHLENLKELHGERFNSIQTQFKERDIRTDQAALQTKTAVDAALQAAKEAVGEQNKSSALAIAKSEAATTKQIDQIGTIANATTNGLNDKIDDIKTRITTIEGRGTGRTDFLGWIVAGVVILGGLVALLARLGA